MHKLFLLLLIAGLFVLITSAPAQERIDAGHNLLKPEMIPDKCPMPEFPEMLGPIVASQGLVVVIVNLDSLGNVVKWELYNEQPPNFGFGDAVEKVIGDWKFKPAIWSGNPVAYNTSVRLKFENGGVKVAPKKSKGVRSKITTEIEAKEK